MLKEWLAVAAGGMLGAVARHGVYWLIAYVGPAWMPFATLVVNVSGCLLIGVLVQWSHQIEVTTDWMVVGARVGFLGSLTTFSAFGLDLIRLWYEDRNLAALALAACHIVLGLAAIILGMALMRTETAPRVNKLAALLLIKFVHLYVDRKCGRQKKS